MTPYGRKQRETKESLDEEEWKESEKAGLKLNIQKTKIMASGPITSWQINGATDWFQIEKGVPQGCILSPCLFNFYAEYIMGNAGLDEAQAGIKIARRNINNLRYADDTTLMAEREEE